MNDRDDNYALKRKKTIENRPFTSTAIQSLFHFLCKKWLGDAFDVHFLARSEWEKKGASGNKTLFIPEDVTSWEMEKILETAGKPQGTRITRRSLESSKNALANFLFEKELDLILEHLPLPYGRLPWEIKAPFPLWNSGQNTLRETGLAEMFRTELEETRKIGDAQLTAKKELDIACNMQKIVREYPFLSNCQHAVKIIRNGGARNCRGASLLGIAILLKGIGIPCLIGDLPKHSIVVLFLSDENLVWFDMMAPIFNETIIPEMIGGVSKNGTPFTYADVVAYAKDPTPDGLMIDIIGDEYREKLSWVKKGQRQFLTLFPPILGSQMQVLNGIAFELAGRGYEERKNENMGPTQEKYYFWMAVEACKLSTGYNPKYEYAYNTMGNALHELGEYEEAIDAYQKSFEVNPMNASCHYGLGRANFVLGRKKEAIASYEKYLELANSETEDFWTKKAKEKIAILKKKEKKK
jgi:tetratricopeptide (TPR) repeat protein